MSPTMKETLRLSDMNSASFLMEVLSRPGRVTDSCQKKVKGADAKVFLFNCMFYQLLHVQNSCSSTQSWASVLSSIVEKRGQDSRGCPLLFVNRNLGSVWAQGTEILYTHSLWEVVDHSRSKMHYTCIIIIHDPGMRPGPESNRGPLLILLEKYYNALCFLLK